MATLLYSQLKRPRDNLLFGKYYHSAKESKVNGKGEKEEEYNSFYAATKENSVSRSRERKRIPRNKACDLKPFCRS